jgi:hypothetical protein
MEVFRTLMAWRRTPLSPDRVKALNMVEIEFHGVKSVETAYGELFRHFRTQITEENSVVWHEANPQYRARACQRCQPSPCRARRRRLDDKIRRRLSVRRPAGIGASCLSPVLQGALSFPDSLLRPCSTFAPQCDTLSGASADPFPVPVPIGSLGSGNGKQCPVPQWLPLPIPLMSVDFCACTSLKKSVHSHSRPQAATPIFVRLLPIERTIF